MKNTMSITGLNGIPFTARIVFAGDTYGRDDCIIHQNESPLVEFYDARYMHTDHGQFVSRYYVETILCRDHNFGLCLDGGVPDWTIDHLSMIFVVNWLKSKLEENAWVGWLASNAH